MLADERRTSIREQLERDGSVVAADLSAEFGVSEDTIRRDLRALATAGLCEKVYGGAMVRTPRRPIAERVGQGVDEKQLIGAATATLLPEGSAVFIDAGSTNLAVAAAVREASSLTIITNAPAVAAIFAGRPEFELIVIGGRIDPELGGAVDARAAAEVAGFSVDVCVLGACGFDAADGLTVQAYEERSFKRAVADRSARIVVPLTADKFTARAPYSIMPLDSRMTFVVVGAVPPEAQAAASRAGARFAMAGKTEAGA